jgi:ADP-heptose:LPS heptosyltransferase
VDLRNTAIPFLVPCKKRSPLFRKFTKINMRERHLEVLEMMGVKTPPPASFQFFDEKDETSCLAKLKEKGIGDKHGWVLVAPGAASGRKRWPADSFREVTKELLKKTGKKVMLVGSKDERPIAEEVNQGIQPPCKAGEPRLDSRSGPACLVLCGEMSLSETAFLISRAALVIANDSAIMHLGFEAATPTVGLFGPTNHSKYGHEGRYFRIAREDASKCNCRSEELPYAERSCFHGLAPTRVTELCLELLK